MRAVEDILTELGIALLTQEEIVDIQEKYRKALLDGMEGESELPMSPSYLDPVDPKTLPDGKQALVIEMGGSNLYVGIVTSAAGEVRVTESHRVAFSKRVYESPEEFFNTVGVLMEPFIGNTPPDALGIIYSWGGRSIKKSAGNDAVIGEGNNGKLAKEFYIPGIESATVREHMSKYLGEKYPFLKTESIATMNDTVAVLLACGAQVGGVVATGFNVAVETPQGIANTESAGFNGIPMSESLKQVNAASMRPGSGITEKVLSGLYAPEHFKIAVNTLREAGYDIAVPDEVDAVIMSGYLEKESDEEQDKIFRTITKLIYDRSAQLVGVIIGTAFKTFHDDVAGEVLVPVEGSLFWGAPGYVDVATKAASLASGKTVKFINIPHAGRLGAGVAALGTLLQK